MYQRIIRAIDPSLSAVDAAGVEGSMRLQHGTLDALSRAEFAAEIRLARECEALEPGHLARCRVTMGVEVEALAS